MKMGPYLTPYPRINSKWIKDLNIRPEIEKLLEKNIAGKLLGVDIVRDFLNYDPKSIGNKYKNGQMGMY
jgi:hypothetical protein